MAPSSRPDRFHRALAETDAMHAIAEILAALPDDESRDRVLRWCREHVPTMNTPASPRPLSGADDRQRPTGRPGGQEPDPALTIDASVFEGPVRKREPVHCDDAIDEELFREPIHCDDGIDDELFREPIHCDDSIELAERETIAADDLSLDDLDPIERAPEPTRLANPAVALESVLCDFVADFKRLALAFA